MEVCSILIQDNVTSRKKLQDLWQETIGNSGSSNKIETISVGCHRKVQSLDGSQESQVFQRTSQIKWITDTMVFETTRLWFYIMPHTWENEHKDKHFIKKGLGGHKRR